MLVVNEKIFFVELEKFNTKEHSGFDVSAASQRTCWSGRPGSALSSNGTLPVSLPAVRAVWAVHCQGGSRLAAGDQHKPPAAGQAGQAGQAGPAQVHCQAGTTRSAYPARQPGELPGARELHWRNSCA